MNAVTKPIYRVYNADFSLNAAELTRLRKETRGEWGLSSRFEPHTFYAGESSVTVHVSPTGQGDAYVAIVSNVIFRPLDIQQALIAQDQKGADFLNRKLADIFTPG